MSTRENLKRQIDEMADKIELLEAKAETVKTELKAEYQSHLQVLKGHIRDVEETYQALATASAKKWEESKETLSSASRSFQEGLEKIKSLFV